jgi:hypothetical protein
VGHITTWIIAALRHRKVFTLQELNEAIQVRLDEYNNRPFQKKEGSRYSLFLEEEKPLLLPLPAAPTNWPPGRLPLFSSIITFP